VDSPVVHTVHVVSRSPSILGDGGTGEFQWYHEREHAAAAMAHDLILFGRETNVNLALTTLEVPAPNEHGSIEGWIDANWHLIEVSLHSSD